MDNTKNIEIYKSHNGEIELQVKLEEETIWLTQKQMSEVFGVSVKTINEHLQNIFSTDELEEDAVIRNFRITAADGKNYNTNHYNLDAIISVGYRVNSKQATEFRKWATSVLKNYLINGYAINKKRLEEKWIQELEETVRMFQKTLAKGDLTSDEAMGLLEIITKYTNSWLWLQKYDEDNLLESGKTPWLHYKLEAREAYESLSELKTDLMRKNEATELFANPRSENVLEGIFGNIYQTFGGQELYPTLEEKASNLLYFIVKNHPFTDGNKRSGAFLFIVFLVKNKILFDEHGDRKINDRALVAITLLIAESDPKQKDLMVKLVMNLIS